MTNPLYRLAAWITSTQAWKLFASEILGDANIRFTGHPTFPMQEYFKIRDILNSQDLTSSVLVFSSRDKKSLSSQLIGAVTGNRDAMTHAGIIIFNGGDNISILHMRADGLVYGHMLDLLREIDEIVINRVDLEAKAKELADVRINYLLQNRTRIKYDYEFKMYNGDKFSCSEAAFIVLDGLSSDTDLKLKEVLGRKMFTPEQLADVGNVIYTNSKKVNHLIKFKNGEIR